MRTVHDILRELKLYIKENSEAVEVIEGLVNGNSEPWRERPSVPGAYWMLDSKERTISDNPMCILEVQGSRFRTTAGWYKIQNHLKYKLIPRPEYKD